MCVISHILHFGGKVLYFATSSLVSRLHAVLFLTCFVVFYLCLQTTPTACVGAVFLSSFSFVDLQQSYTAAFKTRVKLTPSSGYSLVQISY